MNSGSPTKKRRDVKKIHEKKINRAKDELEFATNWTRVFIEIYQKLKWLNSFATINELAAKKILKKFMKVHFEMKDNVVNKQINNFIDDQHFKTRTRLHFAIDDMLQFIAQNFIQNGDKISARKMLEQHNNQIRRSDALLMTFFGGCSLIMFLFGLFFLFIPSSD